MREKQRWGKNDPSKIQFEQSPFSTNEYQNEQRSWARKRETIADTGN